MKFAISNEVVRLTMAALLAIGTATIVTNAHATGSAHGSMKIGATVMPISCPTDRILPSCIKPIQTSARAHHYDLAGLQERGGDPLKLESVTGQLVVVTLTY